MKKEHSNQLDEHTAVKTFNGGYPKSAFQFYKQMQVKKFQISKVSTGG
jgi:hypothetical protein